MSSDEVCLAFEVGLVPSKLFEAGSFWLSSIEVASYRRNVLFESTLLYMGDDLRLA